MTFKPAIWRPIVVVLSILNVGGAGFAVAAAEPWHAATHAVLALGFWYWAQRLRPVSAASDVQGRLEALEVEMTDMRRELSEAQERLDFAERLLAQGREARRVEPERQEPRLSPGGWPDMGG
jgi:hypothetical protein